MLKLRVLIWLTLLGALGGTLLEAAPCPSDDTLDTFLSSGYSCTVGVFTIKNWSFQESASGIPASEIDVMITSTPTQIEIQFLGPFSVTGGPAVTYTISYFIDPPPPIIHGSQIDLDPTGSVNLQTTLCADGSIPCSPGMLLDVLNASTASPTDAVFFEGSFSMMGVQNILTLDGSTGPALSDGFDNIIFLIDQTSPAPILTKAFADSQLQLFGPGNTTALTFTIVNPQVDITLDGIAFSDTLPSGLIVATPDNGLTGTCGGGTITAVPGSNSISLADGSLPASGSCTFSVNVTAIALGLQTNITSPVTARHGDLVGNAAQASTSVTDLFYQWFFLEGSGGGNGH